MKQQAETVKFGGAQHRLGKGQQAPVTFGYDSLYTGSLYFGMRNVEANLIYDTGSDWVVVSSAQCSSCKGSEEKYDPEASNNY